MIRHVGIVVSNLNKAMKFYHLLGFNLLTNRRMYGEKISRLLGFHEDTDMIDLTYVKLINNDEDCIELYKFNNLEEEIPLTFGHFALNVKNIDEVYSKLIKNEKDCWSKPLEDMGIKLMFCRDDDGNLIELVEEL